MIDESRRKQIIITVAAFIGITIVSLAIYLLFFNSSRNLPPTDIKTDPETSVVPDTPKEEATTFKDGIEFKRFEELERFAVTSMRIDVIKYYLAQLTKEEKAITAYTLERDTIKDAKENEMHIITFNSKANTGDVYKIELSYTYAADANVRIFDKDGVVVQASPIELD